MDRYATFEDLTPEQKKVICNGCGPVGWGWLVPDLCFKDAGDRHDAGYYFGGGIEDKLRTDCFFLANCLIASCVQPLFKKPMYACLSFIYFFAVLLGGKRCFRWGERMTREDLSGIREDVA